MTRRASVDSATLLPPKILATRSRGFRAANAELRCLKSAGHGRSAVVGLRESTKLGPRVDD